MICIFCGKENDAKSVEHIVSESLGNKHYLMERGTVCDECNNRFSKFEEKALRRSVLAMERARMAIATKQGKAAKGQFGKFKVQGNEEFKKNVVTMYDVDPEMIVDVDAEKGTFGLVVPTSDGVDDSLAKLLLKIGLEALYASQRTIYKKYDFSLLRSHLLKSDGKDWPFLTTRAELSTFTSIPRFDAKRQLNKIRCSLKISEVDENRLLFKFSYGGIDFVINLLDKEGVLWMNDYLVAEPKSMIYPEHFRKKLEKRLAGKVAQLHPTEELVLVDEAGPTLAAEVISLKVSEDEIATK